MTHRGWRPGGWLLLALALPVRAQFAGLTATDDGSQIYFTSQLTLYNAAPTDAESRLYRIGPEGVSLCAERGPIFSGALGFSSSGNDGIAAPYVSGDGTFVGFTFLTYCPSPQNGVACDPTPAEAVVRGRLNLDLGPGYLQVSRNGRWALVSSVLVLGGDGALIDLSTNQRSTVPSPPGTVSHAIASDGTVLVQQRGPALWKQGQVTPIQFPPGLNHIPLALSDDASTLITIGFALNPTAAVLPKLFAFNISTGKLTLLFTALTPLQLPRFLGMSNNGRYVLYSDGVQAHVADSSTGQSLAIRLPAGETVSTGTLSGTGEFAFLVTSLGRILKVAWATGAIDPLIPETPSISNLNQLTPGSLVRLTGSTSGTADNWRGKLMLDGQPLPVLAAKPGEVDVQVPWEQRPGPASFQITAPEVSPFQQDQTVFVSPIAPTFEPLDPGEKAILPIKIIKGDWSGYQTTQPGPGDVVNIYFTGLGLVNGPVKTGEPASLTTLNPLAGQLTCTFSPQKQPATTLFAGLAPGLIGVYQASFQMPSDAGAAPLNGMLCIIGAPGFQASFGFGIASVTVP
jgi:uncharacterized protein (TIGR03437 family)